MANESSLTKLKLIRRGQAEKNSAHGWTWRTAGAVFGLCGGFIAPLIGSILTAISWFTGPEWHGFFLQRDGTVLLFLTIPLLMFGAHCLDLMDKQQASQPCPEPDKANGFRMDEGNSNDLVRN